MLASIHPLGERARNQHWVVTVAAYMVGSTFGGSVTGLAAGTIGLALTSAWHPSPAAQAVLVMLVAGAGWLYEASGRRPPSIRRQVNEDWLDEYRGWIYGAGFGFQLGLGWATIITSSLVYLTFILAIMTGSPAVGGMIGATFGLSRASPILLTRSVDSPRQLVAFHQRMDHWAAGARRLGAATQALASAAAAFILFGAGG